MGVSRVETLLLTPDSTALDPVPWLWEVWYDDTSLPSPSFPFLPLQATRKGKRVHVRVHVPLFPSPFFYLRPLSLFFSLWGVRVPVVVVASFPFISFSLLSPSPCFPTLSRLLRVELIFIDYIISS